jgi:hypothetical protein
VAGAALFGGAWHGFSPVLTSDGAALLWKMTLAAAGIGDFLLIAGAAFGSASPRAAVWISLAAAGKLAVFLARSLPTDSFGPVVADGALTLATIFALQGLARSRWRAASAPWILGGVAVSVAAAAIEVLRPPLRPPFGPDAAYHLIQLGGLLLFLRGGLLLSNSDPPPGPRPRFSRARGDRARRPPSRRRRSRSRRAGSPPSPSGGRSPARSRTRSRSGESRPAARSRPTKRAPPRA